MQRLVCTRMGGDWFYPWTGQALSVPLILDLGLAHSQWTTLTRTHAIHTLSIGLVHPRHVYVSRPLKTSPLKSSLFIPEGMERNNMTEIALSLRMKSFQQSWKILDTYSVGGLDSVTAKIFFLSLFLALLQPIRSQISWLDPVDLRMCRTGLLAKPADVNRSSGCGKFCYKHFSLIRLLLNTVSEKELPQSSLKTSQGSSFWALKFEAGCWGVQGELGRGSFPLV